jgi:putative phage-type endonuclease
MLTFKTTEEWEAHRLGKFTASEIWKLLGDGKVRETYIYQKAAEILTQEKQGDLSNLKSIIWGNENEIKAVEFMKKPKDFQYFGKNNPVFFGLPNYEEWAGASPDGMDEEYIYEIKCPSNSGNHLMNLQITNEIELLKTHKDYYAQIQFQMLCTRKKDGYFISFDNRFLNKEKILKSIHVPADESFQENLILKTVSAILQLKQLIK